MTVKKKFFEFIDQRLRHNGVIGKIPWLRDFLRKPYHAFLSLNQDGYSLKLGGCIDARVPGEFRSMLMESYEIEEFREIKSWCEQAKGGWFVDVGSSVGYMSCAALSANKMINVLAIDTDLNSLKSVQRLCRFEGGGRLFCLWLMIKSESSQRKSFKELLENTTSRLASPAISGDPGTHRYVNIDDAHASDIPSSSLDQLLLQVIKRDEPLLIKCDIEGAELEALKGMRSIFADYRPTMLLSVHPEKLKKMSHTVDDVANLLSEAGFFWREIAVDHERHWLVKFEHGS